MSGATPNVPNRDLSQVLHHFQLYAMNALGGPSLWNPEMAKFAGARFESYKAAIERSAKELASQLPMNIKLAGTLPTRANPIMLRPDTGCELVHTLLEDETISCFEIGGEKRLCLPQVLQTVLGKLSLDLINQACDDLNIYCSRCNAEQLDSFKQTGDLPNSAGSCGLITLTDAERLCGVLLHSANDAQNNYIIPNSNTTRLRASTSCIPVYHECFGEGQGFLKPNLYRTADSLCIECADCGDLLSTKRFVGHSHGFQENLICHWGFDRNNWRNYILFDKDAVGDEEVALKLELIFNETLPTLCDEQTSDSTLKRRAPTPELKADEDVKLRRFSDSHVTTSRPSQNDWLPLPKPAFPARNEWTLRKIAEEEGGSLPIKPEPRLLSQKSCPPTLENPERVIPSCESSRYGKHFVPNIALQQSDQSQNVDVDSDGADQTSADRHQDVDSRSSNDSGVAKASDKSLMSDEGISVGVESSAYRAVLENLAKMEKQYLQLLHSTVMSRSEKSELEDRYVSYSDVIRKQFTIMGSHAQYKEEKMET